MKPLFLATRFESIGGFEEVPLHLAVNIWDQIEANTSFSIDIQKEASATTAFIYGYCRLVVNSDLYFHFLFYLGIFFTSLCWLQQLQMLVFVGKYIQM